jgi:hypothetical protein
MGNGHCRVLINKHKLHKPGSTHVSLLVMVELSLGKDLVLS